MQTHSFPITKLTSLSEENPTGVSALFYEDELFFAEGYFALCKLYDRDVISGSKNSTTLLSIKAFEETYYAIQRGLYGERKETLDLDLVLVKYANSGSATCDQYRQRAITVNLSCEMVAYGEPIVVERKNSKGVVETYLMAKVLLITHKGKTPPEPDLVTPNLFSFRVLMRPDGVVMRLVSIDYNELHAKHFLSKKMTLKEEELLRNLYPDLPTQPSKFTSIYL